MTTSRFHTNALTPTHSQSNNRSYKMSRSPFRPSTKFGLTLILFFFFLIIRPPPRSPLFPYTTLFRSMFELRRLRSVGRVEDFAADALNFGHFFSVEQDAPGHDVKAMALFRMRLEGSRRLLGSRDRSEEHTSELQSQSNLVCRLLLGKK